MIIDSMQHRSLDRMSAYDQQTLRHRSPSSLMSNQMKFHDFYDRDYCDQPFDDHPPFALGEVFTIDGFIIPVLRIAASNSSGESEIEGIFLPGMKFKNSGLLKYNYCAEFVNYTLLLSYLI